MVHRESVCWEDTEKKNEINILWIVKKFYSLDL